MPEDYKQVRRNQYVSFWYTGVPLATEPGISLIIVPLMRILQHNLKQTYLSV